MTKLSQILAVEKGTKAFADKILTGAYHALQRTSALNGLTKTYRVLNENDPVLPSEATNVQVRTEIVIRDVEKALTRLYDVVATKDWANTVAVADVKLPDGTVVLSKVPVTYLLFLEKQLVDLNTFITKLPVLDIAEDWEFDDNKNVFKTPIVETKSMRKVRKVLTLAPATDKHPAQVESYQEDELAGFWSTVKLSGALPAGRVVELSERVQKLADAVKFAREEANSVTVVDQKVGEAFFGYLFA